MIDGFITMEGGPNKRSKTYQPEISITTRNLPPAHYLLTVESYSALSKRDKYESGIFEAGGYKWKLCLYPGGDKQNRKIRKNFMSLYLVVAEDESLPSGWDIYANFKLFVYDQHSDKYLTFQDVDGAVKQFHEMKKTSGFSEFLGLDTFKDPSNGYLVDDRCVFGAEVFVIQQTTTSECLSIVGGLGRIGTTKFSCKIDNVSSVGENGIDSKPFTAGGKNWLLQIYPEGNLGGKGKSLSLYLAPSGWKSNSDKSSTYAEFKLKVIDQVNENHHEAEIKNWYVPPNYIAYGRHHFISLKNLHNRSNGFIWKNSLCVEVEFVVVSNKKCFSAASSSA